MKGISVLLLLLSHSESYELLREFVTGNFLFLYSNVRLSRHSYTYIVTSALQQKFLIFYSVCHSQTVLFGSFPLMSCPLKPFEDLKEMRAETFKGNETETGTAATPSFNYASNFNCMCILL